VRRTFLSRAKFTAACTSAGVVGWTDQSGPKVPFNFLNAPGSARRHSSSVGQPLSDARSLQPLGAIVELTVKALSGVGGRIPNIWMLGAAKSTTPNKGECLILTVWNIFPVKTELANKNKRYSIASKTPDEVHWDFDYLYVLL
jgi:hypothetical protein